MQNFDKIMVLSGYSKFLKKKTGHHCIGMCPKINQTIQVEFFKNYVDQDIM